MVEIKSGFSLFLQRRGNLPETARLKVYIVQRVLRDLPDLSFRSVETWIEKATDRGAASSYINTIIQSIRLYGRFINSQELTTIRYLPQRKTIKSTMSDDEIEQFLALPRPEERVCPKSGKPYSRRTYYAWWKRYQMFWTILAYSGMRTGEVAALRVQDIDFGRTVFLLENTKTKTPRFVPIAPNIIAQLRSYIVDIEGERLFPAKNKTGHLNNHNWDEDFRRRTKRLGIKRKGLTPYSLRHSFITRLLEEDVSIAKVMKIAGHKNIETTINYTHITTKDICDAIKKHPLIRRSTEPKEILIALVELIKSFHLERDSRFSYRIEENDNSVRFEAYLK